MKQSTICALCRKDRLATLAANVAEVNWREDPIEVSERKCVRCKIRRHWWYFVK